MFNPFRFGKANKYGVAPAGERGLGGITYHSKAEMLRASELIVMYRGGAVRKVRRQVAFQLGEDTKYVTDFVVMDDLGVEHAEEIKGMETREWRRVRKLWRKYGTMPLAVLKRKGRGWQREVIHGGAERADTPLDTGEGAVLCGS